MSNEYISGKGSKNWIDKIEPRIVELDTELEKNYQTNKRKGRRTTPKIEKRTKGIKHKTAWGQPQKWKDNIS